jgi:hypothetical protein
LAVYPVAVRVLLTFYLLGIVRKNTSTETLAVYPVAVGVLLTFHLLWIFWKEAGTQALAIHPIAPRVLFALLFRSWWNWPGWNWWIVGNYVYYNCITYLTIDNEEQYVLTNSICIEVYLVVTRVKIVVVLSQVPIGIYFIEISIPSGRRDR